MTETLGILVMLLALVISIVPYLPGPALLWAVGTIFAIATKFEHVTPLAVVIMTLFMLIGSTTEIWLRGLGMKTRGASCWGTLGSIIGGIIGTFFMPIIGTLIGAVLGALLIEFMRLGDTRKAFEAGRSAFEMFILGMIVEFAMSAAIFAVFVASILIMR